MALVLPGGGARGAYEAGALSVLLPLLKQRGEEPAILCGTSVGAINAALLASLAARAGRDPGRDAVRRWAALERGKVIRRVIGPGHGAVSLVKGAPASWACPSAARPGCWTPRR